MSNGLISYIQTTNKHKLFEVVTFKSLKDKLTVLNNYTIYINKNFIKILLARFGMKKGAI